ncbi:MAG: hypothetical protein A7315_10395 [Candidatus Altiarchaeales archaeon WOR_SM1_79]|nr:MAG: hypothetical protein A7315_10395 [Candidatus Altiarchaeales archaeon WOR_SM1_79]
MVSKFIENAAAMHHGLLIPVLQDIQEEYGYLSEEAVSEVAKQLEIKMIDVYGVASFYGTFSFTPKGKHIIIVCLGTACHVRGASNIVDLFSQELGINPGETTQDLKFTLETVTCLGCCALGPVVVVDGKYHGNMTPSKVEKLLSSYNVCDECETIEKNKISI